LGLPAFGKIGEWQQSNTKYPLGAHHDKRLQGLHQSGM
jgi:hypothetical protein